ncbi:hypothetical protein GEMRC1_005787 [Eukaryota sp. GEM-RC1]
MISSLTISSNIVLFFQCNASLTVSDILVINGGSLRTDPSYPISYTSVDSLLLDADHASLFSHKLVVTRLFDWKRGSIDLDGFSEVGLVNVTYTSSNDDQSPISSDVLHGWGRNDYGQLGEKLSDRQQFPVLINVDGPIKQVSAGSYHSLVLMTNGDVYTAGRMNYVQLEVVVNGWSIHEKIEISHIIQVLASFDFSHALSSSGLLGLGTRIDGNTPNLISNLNNVKQIAGRLHTTFALTKDGKVFGWGRAWDNILCIPSTADVLSPMLIESLQNIKFVAAGFASFFIKEDDSTLTCGPKLGGFGTYSTPTQFAPAFKFTFIDTAGHHVVGFDFNQKLWSWGSGHRGQLGTGGTSSRETPVAVIEIGKVITAAAGMSHSIAVDVNNDVWSWGDRSGFHLGRGVSSFIDARTPGRITDLEGKGITGVIVNDGSNFAYISVPFPTLNSMTSSNKGHLTIKGDNLISGCLNDNGLLNLNQISLPVFLFGSLRLTSDSFFFLSNFNSNGFLSVNSPLETRFNSLILGESECSTLYLESDVFVETLYWYCGLIEGVAELKVNTLLFCSSNPELNLSRISIGKMMTSKLNVELNHSCDLVISITGIFEIPHISFFSALDVTLTFMGNFKLVNTSLTLFVESLFKSTLEIDHNSKIRLSNPSTIEGQLPLFLYYDWSKGPSENDLSGNNNNVLELSGAKWHTDGYYQFKNITDTLNIPNVPGKFGWESATISLLIWFDSDFSSFGLTSCGCHTRLGDWLNYGCSGSPLSMPRNQWINLVMSTSKNQARFYINGVLVGIINSQYNCDTPSDFFPLGNDYLYSSSDEQWERRDFLTTVFQGRIKKVYILTRGLPGSEITSEFGLPQLVTGLGSIELLNSELTLSGCSSLSFSKLILQSSVLYLNGYTFFFDQGIYAFNESEVNLKNVQSSYLNHSHIHLDNSTLVHSAIELKLYNLTLSNTVFKVPSSTERLSIHALFVWSSNFRVDSSIILNLNQLHWIHGKLSFLDVLEFKGLFLYEDAKIWPQNSLEIETELYFNNSLTFSISQLSLITVSVTCYPGSELIIDSSSIDESLLEVKKQLQLTSNCALTSLLPVQSTGFITVANDSVMTLFKDFSTTGMFVILPKGELALMNSNIKFGESGLYLHPDLFLFYNWVTSSNQIDLSGNHESNKITISGPTWKTDRIGGYLEITNWNRLDIPNVPGEFGWRGASISLWIYFEEGGMGFGWSMSPCRFIIRENEVHWGDTFRVIFFPLNKWFNLVITLDQIEAHIYVDSTYEGSVKPTTPYKCARARDVPSQFSLSAIGGSDIRFRGRVRAVQIFTKTLTFLEINQLTFDHHARIWGQGKLSLVNLEMMISSHTFGVQKISLVSSTIYLDHWSTELKSIELYVSELYYTASGSESKLVVDSLYLTNTSSIITNASLVVSNFHWFDGDLFSPEILTLKGLFLYGDSKTWPLEYLIIEKEMYFNNSLTFSLTHLNLLAVSATCFPGSELVIDSSSFDKGLLDIEYQIHLTSNCSLTSLLPVQSTGIIIVANDSVMTLYKDFSTTNKTIVFPKGELELRHSNITFEESDLYLHPDLFLYYNWVTSFNRIDLSGNHDSSDILIHI